VPPSVFAIGERSLGYLSLAEEGELTCQESHLAELGEDCFQAGPLGGRLRDVEGFTRALDALLGKMIRRPREASLVVPDNWMRLTFVELEEWPRRQDEQLEILRFKLGRIVPFRVLELRIGAERVPALTDGSAHRFAVGFGIESAFGQLEEIFEDRGIRIGDLSNASLSLLEALKEGLEPAPLGAVVSIDEDRYALIVTRHGSPIVYRSKAHGSGESLEPVARELRLTKSFLQERVEPGILSDLVLAAPESREAAWRPLLEEVFEIPVASLAREWSAIPGLDNLTFQAAAPLLGAALREVA
jgi:hypothetical protein